MATTPKKSKLDTDCGDDLPTPTKEKVNFNFWGESTNEDTSAAKENFEGSSSQLDKMKFEFWNLDDEKEKELSLGELSTGSHGRTLVKFRATYVSELGGLSTTTFRFHGLDNSREMEIIAFGKAAEKFKKIIKVNGVYSLKNFYVTKEKSLYPTGFHHGLQIVVEDDGDIKELENFEDAPPIPFNFTELGSLDGDSKTGIDALVAVIKIWPPEHVATKTGKIWKRDLSVTDRSKAIALLTFWGNMATDFSKDILFKVIAIRNATVKWIKSMPQITTSFKPANTLIWLDPPIQDAVEFQKWLQENIPHQKKSE